MRRRLTELTPSPTNSIDNTLHRQTDLQRLAVLCQNRGTAFIVQILFLPMLTDRVRAPGQPCPVLGELQNLRWGKILTLFGIGFPNGLSSRAITRIGTSCGWQLSTQAACSAVKRDGGCPSKVRNRCWSSLRSTVRQSEIREVRVPRPDQLHIPPGTFLGDVFCAVVGHIVTALDWFNPRTNVTLKPRPPDLPT
jgi:hypothetical protein